MSQGVFTSGMIIDKHGNQFNVPVIAETKEFKPNPDSEFIDIIIDFDNETPDLSESDRLKLATITFPVGFNKVFNVDKIETNQNLVVVRGQNILFDAETHNLLSDSTQSHNSFVKLVQSFVEPQDTRQLYEEMKTRIAREAEENKRDSSKQSSASISTSGSSGNQSTTPSSGSGHL
jgi:hypothetical protein